MSEKKFHSKSGQPMTQEGFELGVAHDEEYVHIGFEPAVDWLMLTPEEARIFARSLLTNATRVDGMSYSLGGSAAPDDEEEMRVDPAKLN